MKKLILTLAAAALSLAAFAQAQIKTMKMKIADFPEKVTKVVLSGNSMHDARLQSIVKNNWSISPVEFCTLEEFETLKKSPDYYFLLTVKGQFSKESEPGIEYLSLVKGGIGSSDTVNELFNVVDVPYRAVGDRNSREYVILPALLTIIQDHVTKSLDNDIEGYSGLSNYNMNLPKSKAMRIIYAEQDLANDILPSVRAKYFTPGIEAMDADDADDIFTDSRPNTLVSFVVAPVNPQDGSYCYKMLIDSETYALYYYRRHKITRKYGPGFLTEDVKRISSAR